jgi:hypothetical protein
MLIIGLYVLKAMSPEVGLVTTLPATIVGLGAYALWVMWIQA